MKPKKLAWIGEPVTDFVRRCRDVPGAASWLCANREHASTLQKRLSSAAAKHGVKLTSHKYLAIKLDDENYTTRVSLVVTGHRHGLGEQS